MSAKTATRAVIDLVKGRDESGLCEIGTVCGGRAVATETAHRLGKQTGGVGKKNTTKNGAANLLRGCTLCHVDIDNQRVKNAESLGLKVRDGKPRPSEIPVKHPRFGWVLLDDEGGRRPAPELAYSGAYLIPVVTVGPWALIAGSPSLEEAIARYGHGSCQGWPGVLDGLLVCSCGSTPFLVDEVVR